MEVRQVVARRFYLGDPMGQGGMEVRQDVLLLQELLRAEEGI